MTIEDRQITADEFEAAREAIWGIGMTNLRFAIFDLGSLLLRNDKDGTRRKQWKDEVSTWFYSALNDSAVGLQDKFTPSNPAKTINGLAQSIKRFYSVVEYYMMELGKSVMEEDQYDYYRVRLNNALYDAQRDTAEKLYKLSKSTERRSLSLQYDPSNVRLEGLKWKNRCTTESEYEFVVAEDSAPICRQTYIGA